MTGSHSLASGNWLCCEETRGNKAMRIILVYSYLVDGDVKGAGSLFGTQELLTAWAVLQP